MFKKAIFGVILGLCALNFIACSSDSSVVENLAEEKCKEDINQVKEKMNDEVEGLIKFMGGFMSDEKKEQMRDALEDVELKYKIIEVTQDKENPNKIIAKCKVELNMEVEKDGKVEKFEEKGIESYHYIKNNDKWELEKSVSEKIKD